MKKILLAGFVILIAVLFVTCDGLFPEEAEVEYTDVVYSKDGSQVTVYLDGVGVPKPKAQRAMSLGLSEMAYDYLEVIFVTVAPNAGVARSQWELGESAGISGVKRDLDYNGIAASGTKGQALMAVGTKDGKTLLGIGEIINLGDSSSAPAAWPPAATVFNIGTSTKCVTFGLMSVKTGLQGGSPAKPTLETGVNNSFVCSGATSDISTLGGSGYPMYSLPAATAADTAVAATYTFQGAVTKYAGVLVWGDPEAKKRIPRYMESGRYMIPRGRIDTKTKVEASAVAAGVVTLGFITQPDTSGIFSFYVDVPVNLASTDTGTNGGELESVNWHLRTGFGADLYSLDDGLSSGGCVLMGLAVGVLDWLEIQWVWME